MPEKYTVIKEILVGTHGIDISKYDDSFLDKAIQKRMAENRCDAVETYCTQLEISKQERIIFINSLNISYSEFFRNPLTFAVLERIILPSLVINRRNSKKKEIRIWSAACAAGQETYSLAMLIEELRIGNGDENFFRIFATDLDESQLNEARKGQYQVFALKNLNLNRINQWFTKNGDTYSVKPELKIDINFSPFDLLNEQLACPCESIFGDFDLIFCANLLFYYKPEYRTKILGKLGRCLANGGYLITGETEREILLKQNFREVYPQSAIFQITF